MRITGILGISVMAVFHLSLSITFATLCLPTTGSSRKDFFIAASLEKCQLGSSILVVIQGVGNVITDIFLLILPLPAIWNSQMPLRRKISVSSMFLIGFW